MDYDFQFIRYKNRSYLLDVADDGALTFRVGNASMALILVNTIQHDATSQIEIYRLQNQRGIPLGIFHRMVWKYSNHHDYVEELPDWIRLRYPAAGKALAPDA